MATLPGPSQLLLVFPKADVVLRREAASRMSEKLDCPVSPLTGGNWLERSFVHPTQKWQQGAHDRSLRLNTALHKSRHSLFVSQSSTPILEM